MDKTDKIIMFIKILMIIFILGFIVFSIWTLAKYGNMSITEVPIWVFWFLGNRG